MAQAVSSSISGRVGGARDMSPMVEINTTPLIDVMLVLLIMFIITVPIQSHEVEVALPQTGSTVEIDRLKNELGLSQAGQLSWNGQRISDGQLAATLGAIADMAEQPEVHFRPDAAARYQRVDEVLAIAARSGAEAFGFAGNEQYEHAF